MFPSFLLALREGLEAALIIVIVLLILKKMERSTSKNLHQHIQGYNKNLIRKEQM